MKKNIWADSSWNPLQLQIALTYSSFYFFNLDIPAVWYPADLNSQVIVKNNFSEPNPTLRHM